MCWLLLGFILQLLAVAIRATVYRNQHFTLSWSYAFLTILSIIGCVFAFVGFTIFAHAAVHPGVDYGIILTVLALLSAGIIAGFFTFSYQEAGNNDKCFPNFISIGFTLLFYLLFGAVSFYIGKSEQIHKVEYASTIVPIIMALILAVNSLFDFWDYNIEEENDYADNSLQGGIMTSKRRKGEDSDPIPIIPIVVSGVALLYLAIVACFYVMHFNGGVEETSKAWADFGEYFGGASTPILSFFALIAVLWTVIIQNGELKLAREEMRESQDAFRIQNFEKTFFEMLHLMGNIVDDISLKVNDSEMRYASGIPETTRKTIIISGRACFKHLRDELQENYDTLVKNKTIKPFAA